MIFSNKISNCIIYMNEGVANMHSNDYEAAFGRFLEQTGI